MVDFADLKARIRQGLSNAEQVVNSASYQRLASIFSEVEARLREFIQGLTRDEISAVIKKLEGNEKLAQDELKLVKLWIVGDAEYYARMENDFQDWFLEIKRVAGEIDRIDKSTLDLEAAVHLRAMAENAKRVSYDVVYFLEKKERLANFEESTSELDSEEMALLAKMLKQALVDKRF